MIQMPITRRLLCDQRGVAAIEMGIGLLLLSTVAFNGIEFANWFNSRMMVANVAQAAAQNAWQACDTKKLPATTKCPGLNTAISNSLQESKLGTSVALATGYPKEGYYCVNAAGALTLVGAIADPKPATCTTVGDPTHPPGDYLLVAVTYTYQPLLPGATFIKALPTALTRTAYVRLQ